MCVCTKFQVSSIVLTCFKQGGNFSRPNPPPPPPHQTKTTSKEIPKKPAQIRVKTIDYKTRKQVFK